MPTKPLAIDTRMGGVAEGTACYLVRGDCNVLVDTGPAASVADTVAGLEAAEIEHLDWIVVTHLHLDHAGAAGHLAERYPRARIGAPERACRHLVDPERLYAGTAGVWGDRTDALLGKPRPIDSRRLVPLLDGSRIGRGDCELRAVATPGHTRHHLSFLHADSGAALCGDALGIRLPGSPLARPATPPADFSLEDSLRSIERVRCLGAGSLLLAHYGDAAPSAGGVDAACELASAVLEEWARVMTRELLVGGEGAEARVERALRGRLGADEQAAFDRLEQVNPTWLNVRGFEADLDRRSAVGA